MKKINADYFRSVLFGIEDGLVSTTGVIVGISTGTGDQRVIILAGIVAVIVEAMSMGAGEMLSEKTVLQIRHKNSSPAILGGVLMFCSYAAAGMIPVLPFLFWPVKTANFFSVAFALMSLFILGYVKGKVIKVPALKSAWEIFLVGGMATVAGLIIGQIFKL